MEPFAFLNFLESEARREEVLDMRASSLHPGLSNQSQSKILALIGLRRDMIVFTDPIWICRTLKKSVKKVFSLFFSHEMGQLAV